MEVVSVCPLRVASLLWEQKSGEWIMTVVVKATFQLVPGDSRLASEQDFICEEANFWNDDPNRSLYLPSDLAPFKRRSDVLLVGHAFAPRGEPVRSLVTRLIVGEVNKGIEVHGDRAWAQDGTLREGPRFVKMPLRYERASGGADSTNPVGIGLDGRRDVYGNAPLPNLQPTGLHITDPSDFIEPIGYGPISPAWPSRRDKLGPHASTWSDATWTQAPLPPEIHPTYWNSAPIDQQVDEIRDNEQIVLENLSPKHPRLVTRLPGVRPRAMLERGDRGVGTSEVGLSCDTLWIDTDRSVCTLTWRGRIALSSPQERGRVRVSIDEPEPARPVSFTQSFDMDDPPTNATGELDDELRLSGLPFQIESSPNMSGASVSSERKTMPPGAPRGPDSITDNIVMRKHSRPPARTELAMRTPGDASPAWLAASAPLQAQAQPPPPPPPPAAPPPPPPLPPATPQVPPVGAVSFGAVPVSDPETVAAAPVAEVSSAPIAPPLVASPWAANVPGQAAGPVFGPVFGASLGVSPLPWAASNTTPRGEPASIAVQPATPVPPATPFVSPEAVAVAATVGAVAASDAAANAARAQSALPAKPALVEAERPPPAPRAPALPDAVELLWFNPKSLKRIKTWWKEIVTNAEFETPDDRHEIPSDDPEEDKSRRVVFNVITEVKADDAGGVTRAVLDAVSEKGRFTPPMIVVGGELRLPFDDVEALKAIVGAVTPVIGGDKKLKESVDAVNELLKTPYLQGSNGMVQKISNNLQDQLNNSNRGLPPNFIDNNVERLLLEQRNYQKRKVFGEPWIRALLYAGSENPIPTYLPEATAAALPMSVAIRARMIAEVYPQQDQYETHSYALKVAALGRVLKLEGRRF